MRGANQKRTARARSLRKVENDAEAALWSELRARRLGGYKFVRQLPIGPFFADFACREALLVVEVDGSQHADSEHDAKRNAFMNANGWSVVRFWNADVLREREAVLDTLIAILDGRINQVVLSCDPTYLPAERPA
ncbi:endonuclease domain-containing protein [Rhizobium sp. AG855]|uniref:endonuclease domain-containing protein n=1 Tax=Rhizobium sp. AG855 TaxID=2183898 RepID=UPI000E70E24D|nr:endonuclease domain-containing protein [Rhizobium sp. AG855]RKE84065.1 very-short-patch-repair endonuclease [Rhizobium sp. AG855]